MIFEFSFQIIDYKYANNPILHFAYKFMNDLVNLCLANEYFLKLILYESLEDTPMFSYFLVFELFLLAKNLNKGRKTLSCCIEIIL